MREDGRSRRYSAAHFFLEGLNELGIEYLFSNFGTDHAPILEAMAQWQQDGRPYPEVVICPHENTAVHMAVGFATATGRGQVVFVHVDAGTANATMGLQNARRARLPILLVAGRAPHTMRGELPGSRDNYVHFIQEPYDQGAMVRSYVKWEWTLPTGLVTKEALRRAHSIAHSGAQGPVYLMLPRETLAEEWDEAEVASFPAERYGPVSAGGADPDVIAQIAERLMAGQHPVLVTSYAGRHPETPPLLDELARFAGIRVFETTPLHLNISRASPCFAGFVPDIASADVGLLVDVDVPWIPQHTTESPTTWWAHIDVDVIKECFPMWGFASNLRLPGNSLLILRQLLTALREKATPSFREAAAKRVEAMVVQGEKRRALMAAEAAKKGQIGAIHPHYLCSELSKAIGDEAIVVNEAIRNAPIVNSYVLRTRPGSAIASAGGGLGSSSGTALGIKLAKPNETVIQIVGDGSFYLGNPSSVYAVSKQRKLPIFTIVLDNGGWAAVKASTLGMYPAGAAKASNEFHSLLAADVDFAKVCESAGGYGERVEDPDAVPAALQRCLAEVRSGRSALIHARIATL